jgi:hypothetical protein
VTRARTTRSGQGQALAPHRIAALSLVALALLSGCGPAASRTEPPASETATPSTAAPQSDAPTAPGSVAPAPTDPPDSLPPAETVEPSRTPSSAAACAGNTEQQDFYAAVADAVDWAVYCPALPNGWFVESGLYRLRDGGWLEINYKGPGGATLEFREGAFCTEAAGCVPAGTDVGAAAFGDRQGTLVAGDDGSLAVVVDRGAPISWLAVARGLDEGTFLEHAATLGLVDG